MVGGHGRLLGFHRVGDLIVLLLRDFFILDEHRVARKIGLPLREIGLRFGEASDGGFPIALGHAEGLEAHARSVAIRLNR